MFGDVQMKPFFVILKHIIKPVLKTATGPLTLLLKNGHHVIFFPRSHAHAGRRRLLASKQNEILKHPLTTVR